MGDNPKLVPESPSEVEAVNEMYVLHKQVADTSQNWALNNVNIPKHVLAIDTDKRIIKVGEGKPWSDTKNHTHDDQYSSISHSHYFGYSEKWFRACPRLWYTRDLEHHPELIPLNGQELSEELAFYLSEIYTSIVPIHPLATAMDTDQYQVTMSNANPLCLGYKAFGPNINMENLLNTTDQWTTGTTTASVTSEWLALDLKGDISFTLHTYALVARSGSPTAPFAPSPSPKSWIVEVALDDGPWEVVDIRIDEEVWAPNEVRYFYLDTISNPANKFRITIEEWWVPEGPDAILELGIRRWYLGGKKIGSFIMPKIVSPHPDFTYVVPINDLGIGMKHEEIGDVGYSVTRLPLIPSNRIILDGRTVEVEVEPELYAVCGQKYADSVSPAAGASIVFSAGIGADNTPYTHDITFSESIVIGQYSIGSSSGIYPASWSLEALVDGIWYDVERVADDLSTAFKVRDVYINNHASDTYRLVITKWTENVLPIGTISFSFKGSPAGTFKVPNKLNEAPTDMVPYVVSKVRTEDINSSVVLDLQNALLSTQQQLAIIMDRLIQNETELTNLRAQVITP